MRTIDFSYRVLRNGTFLGFLQCPVESAPTIRMSESAEIKTSLSGTFSPTVLDADGNDISADWLRDEIQPVLILDGEENELGVFAPSTVTPSDNNGVESLHIEAFDRCWRVRDTNTDSRLYIAAGTNYVEAITSMVVGAGIPVVLATPTDAVFPEDREDWDIGTSMLKIVNELLDEINYNPLWFTAEGYAVLEPASVPVAENIEHRISDAPDEVAAGAGRIDKMFPRMSRETDVYQAPNVFVAWCANPDKSGNMIARAENTNPQSPLSIPRRGRQIVKVTRLDNIASQQELQAYVDRQRNMSMISGETIKVATELLPGFGVDDVVALRFKTLSALCILRGYTMELRVGGSMQMTLERVVYNID